MNECEVTQCPECGRYFESRKMRKCRLCGREICPECVNFIAVHKKTIYRDYEELIPVCSQCTPRVMLNRKLNRMIDEVFGEVMEKRIFEG